MQGGQDRYYTRLAEEHYFLKGTELAGTWVGRGAIALGLERSEVLASDLSRLMGGGCGLVQLQRGRVHQPGWDLTFSAPKSVSILWSQLPLRERMEVGYAHEDAVREALSYLEQHAALSRRGKGGHRTERAGLLIATFEHRTSRALDPQLHTHSLVMNAGWRRSDRTWGTLRSRDLYQHKMAAGAIYRAHLGRELVRRLGIELERRGTCFEVRGVPHSLLRRFSSRRRAIESAMQAVGSTHPRVAEKLALRTRKRKTEESLGALLPRWRLIGFAHGFFPGRLLGHRREYSSQESLVSKALRAAHDLAARDGTFLERDLLRSLAESVQGGGASRADLEHAARHILRSLPEGPGLSGYKRYTTWHQLTLEESALFAASRLAERASRPVLGESIMRALKETDGARGAALLTELLAGSDLAVLPAADRSLLADAKRAWRESGMQVLGATLSARAASQLRQETGIDARTISDLLADRTSILRGSVIVVDEAGRLGTKELCRLLRWADRVRAKVVLVGDAHERPFAAGGLFKALAERLGQAVLSPARIEQEAWIAECIRSLSEGAGREMVRELERRQRLHVSQNRRDATATLIAQWSCSERPFAERMIVSTSKEEARRLNRLAQAARPLQAGTAVVHDSRISLYRCDRIRFLRNDRSIGTMNGELGTIEKTDQRTGLGTVRLDRGARVLLDLRHYPHLELGYASTVERAPRSVPEVYALMGEGAHQDRDNTLSQLLRAESDFRLFASEIDVGPRLRDLVRALERDREKRLALEQVRTQTQELSF